ncbi:MAG: hypothetical protein GKR87_05810 [Kiritimatiellae bacterium]|nr:hypothetical protein [Kiritimatiellia bacterium]
MIKIIYETCQQITSYNGNPVSEWVQPYEQTKNPGWHQFVLFLKPELTAIQQGVHLSKGLELVFNVLDEWGIQIGAVCVLNGDYLYEYRIMDHHYGVINQISLNGEPAITQHAQDMLHQHFSEEVNQGAKVLGGHQFLEACAAFTPLALSAFSANLGTEKLGGGTYALSIKIQGQRYIILNPFHPYQLEPFYASSNALVALECMSDKPWTDLRTELVGATNPVQAEKGSLRNLFLQQKDELGMADVSSSSNGVHLSAGPLEGMVEIQRFFTEHGGERLLSFRDTCFGQLLAQQGASEEKVLQLAKNPNVEINGYQESAFDVTEEMDAQEAVEKLL